MMERGREEKRVEGGRGGEGERWKSEGIKGAKGRLWFWVANGTVPGSSHESSSPFFLLSHIGGWGGMNIKLVLDPLSCISFLLQPPPVLPVLGSVKDLLQTPCTS